MKTYKDNSRNAYMLVYEKKVKHALKLQVLEGDSTTSPRTITRDFECLNRTIPTSVYQAVMSDNDKYFLQKNIFNSDFFSFLLDAINSAIATEVDITDTVLPYVFEVLFRCYHNKILPEIILALKKLFDLFPHNVEKFIKSQLEDNLQSFSNLLLICTEKITREAVGDFFAYCLIKLSNSNFSDNCDSKVFISSLLAIIPQDLGKHWTRFQQFWQLFRDFALGGEVQSVYLLNSGVISTFIDFYLAEKSPLLRPGEKRNSLGNKMWTPCFDPLVQTIAAVSQYCTTASGSRAYELSELDKKCLFDQNFYEKTLTNSYDCKSLGSIIQYWSTEDLKYSEGIAKMLLKALNDRDFTDLQGLFDVIAMFLTIEDSFNDQRIEWMLGFPVITKLLVSDLCLPYFASASISAIDEEIYSYPSTLELFNTWNGNDGILALIWKFHKRWEGFCLVYIKFLLKIFNLSDEIARFAKNLPPPTYQYTSFVHWLEEFIHKNRSSAYSATKEDAGEEAYQHLIIFKEKYGLKQDETYIIGKTTDKNARGEFENGDITLKVIEYQTEWAVSEPDGSLNKSLPSKLLKSEKSSYSIEIPYKSINPSGNYEADTDDSIQERDVIVPELSLPQEFTQVRFEVLNRSSSTVKVRLLFNKKPNLNFLCPASVITVEVPSQNSKDIIVLSKIVPSLPWPEIDYKWEVINEDNERINEDQYYDNNLQHYSDDVAVNVSDDDIRAASAQVSCPRCTSFNDSAALKCEICDLVFKAET